LDEQRFLVQTINALQRLPTWRSTAVLVAYDDPGGWYDHVAPRIVNNSSDAKLDVYTSDGHCGLGASVGYPLRCGYAERLPLLAISPYARVNHVDHRLTDQTSILRFIEKNWRLGQIGDQSYDAQAGSILHMFDFSHRRAGQLLLDPSTGEVVRH
jgi:phospholipase C